MLVTKTDHGLNEILCHPELDELPIKITSIIGRRLPVHDRTIIAGQHTSVFPA